MMDIGQIRARLQELSAECFHTARELDPGAERTELFCLHDVLRKLSTPGYGVEVHDTMNPLLCGDDEEWEG